GGGGGRGGVVGGGRGGGGSERRVGGGDGGGLDGGQRARRRRRSDGRRSLGCDGGARGHARGGHRRFVCGSDCQRVRRVRSGTVQCERPRRCRGDADVARSMDVAPRPRDCGGDGGGGRGGNRRKAADDGTLRRGLKC